MIPDFKSRPGLWLLRIGILGPLVLLSGFLVFELGGCNIGLNHAGTCSHIPTFVGNAGFFAGIAGAMAGISLGPLMVIIGLVLEYIARRAAREE